jgi:CDGSH-type Zn-finger protein
MVMAEVIIRCRENGPLLVAAAQVRIVDHLGNEYPLPPGKENIALCRCGQSQSKPFCDGSHKSCGFQGGVAAPVRTSPDGAAG